ncbi:MAG: hypothetical protein J0G32_04775 [Alphaproteobacteria bacterium]|nr:hypothetical protein [Alphaproteobacteria bacterium]OJV13743.1 MAG: hypothetical protein BGO27_07070 [Alphaproteobacteria bacterium 33-17]
MKNIFLACSLILASSCADFDDLIRYSDYSYHDLARYNFNVKDIVVEHLYQSPVVYPNAEHLAPISPDKAVSDWVKYNFFPTRGSEDILKIVIVDASIVEKKVHVDTTYKDLFVKKQNINYEGRVELNFQIFEKGALTPKATMEVNATMAHTGNNDDSPAQKERLLYDLTKSLLTGVANQVDNHVYNYLGTYVQ